MRKVQATFQCDCETRVHRVVRYTDLPAQWEPDLRFLVLVQSEKERLGVEDLRSAGLAHVAWVESAALEDGDVVVPNPNRGECAVLLRESDAHHALFMTNRCNSLCLMCSQPPTPNNDSWLVAEAVDAIQHLRWSPPVLGLTGGEPLLLGDGLRCVLDAVQAHHPRATVEVLTNGRLLANSEVATQILQGLTTRVRWLIPLYGHADFLHDFVVQVPGAFDETLTGLLTLQTYQQEIQLRTVLIEPVLQVLPELAGFVGRNLPFVREMALMGCEPIGFALANRELCEVDLGHWGDTLAQAARILRRHAIPHLIMNVPLCALPRSMWSLAHRSISDWKNVYAAECGRCVAKSDCSGLFAWHESGWKPSFLKPLDTNEVIA
ncbi:His-Xaa-Ser system radical SAM maturase HxsC [Hydrogenophaga sp. OTU3427]|uniref:His-Xaa-Ser system radical SAM maturase HxsC n=1 Tax=Hydrogenophaga sp. OTU3427 TaxID=3043856 RepID=UPI00313D2408